MPLRFCRCIFLLCLLFLPAACNQMQPDATATSPVPVTATAALLPTSTRPLLPVATTPATPTATVPATVMATAVAATAAPPAEPEFPPGQNPFQTILGEVRAPEGWLVKPCGGEGPLLCIRADGEPSGIVELLVLPMESLPDFQAILAEYGLEPGSIDRAGEAYQAAALPVLETFAANHLATVEADRRLTYGDSIQFMPQSALARQFGSLPGVTFGFTITNEEGRVVEQYIIYAAFTDRSLYLITAAYDPANVTPTFNSHEDLVRFAPYLEEIVAGLRL